MAQRITIDPITRIEGHLRIEVEVSGGKVVNAITLCSAPAGSERTPMLCPR